MNRAAKALLVAALVGVVGMAFRVSWNAQRDVARTVGADTVAALLYPFVVDGLMALALVATLVLTGRDRAFALRVLAGYTVASLVLNYVHGLVPGLHGGRRVQLADWAPANWALVLLATSLPVGSIFFGSDLVAKVLHHQPERAARQAVQAVEQDERAGTAHPPDDIPEEVQVPGPRRTAPERAAVREPVRAVQPAVDPRPQERTTARTGPADTAPYAQVAPRTPVPDTPPAKPPVRAGRTPVGITRSRIFEEAELERTRQRAEEAYAQSLDAGTPIGPAALAREFGFSEGWGRKRIKAVEERRATNRQGLHLVSTQPR